MTLEIGRIVISQVHDPAYNLALEEALIGSGDNILYLWQNNETVVIGRNQNPYKECNIARIEKDRVKLVRRKTGGGAVFHDLGNLNFTLISKKGKKNIEENFQLVNKSLSYQGIDSVFNGRNDLHVAGKKISGNAFMEKKGIFCHHGTLLVDVDMDRLSSYLTASKLKLESKGIDSVKSRVINLKDIRPDITIKGIEESFIKAYRELYNIRQIEYYNLERMKKDKKIDELARNYRSWDWTYGESPKANLSFERKYKWGIIQVDLNIQDGKIKNARINTDSIINDKFEELSKNLVHKNFERSELIRLIEENLKSKEIREDLINEIKKL